MDSVSEPLPPEDLAGSVLIRSEKLLIVSSLSGCWSTNCISLICSKTIRMNRARTHQFLRYEQALTSAYDTSSTAHILHQTYPTPTSSYDRWKHRHLPRYRSTLWNTADHSCRVQHRRNIQEWVKLLRDGEIEYQEVRHQFQLDKYAPVWVL